jgi:hypothetical protein
MFVTDKPPFPENAVRASAAAADAAARPAPSTAPPPPARRVLFLDDDARRVEVFLDRCPEAVWVRSAEACIARLAQSWDEVHLDHDLGGEQFVDTNRDDCGMAVVRWLCAEPREQLRNTRFFIHSYNLAAAAMMVQCLLRSGYTAEFRPFGFDLVDLLSFEDFSPALARRASRASRRRLWRVRFRMLVRGLKRICRKPARRA